MVWTGRPRATSFLCHRGCARPSRYRLAWDAEGTLKITNIQGSSCATICDRDVKPSPVQLPGGPELQDWPGP